VYVEKGYSVAVMEMGRRWEAKDFAKNNWNTRRWIWRPGIPNMFRWNQ
jgi:cholesterol oxidase